MTTRHPQTARPWELRKRSTGCTDPVGGVSVWMINLFPKRANGEGRYSVATNARYAAWVARQPGVLGAAWSKKDVDVVVEAGSFDEFDEGDSLPWQVLDSPVDWFHGIPRASTIVTTNPSEWDWAQPSAERLAREALTGRSRHQCQRATFCICAERGTEFDDPTKTGERGFVLGQPAHAGRETSDPVARATVGVLAGVTRRARPAGNPLPEGASHHEP